MPVPPTPHTPEHEELAALYALRSLEGEEREGFVRHLASCPRCEQVVRQDRQTLAGLSQAAPEMEPSTGFKQRLLERAAAARTRQGRPPPPALRPVPLRRRSAWLLPLAAALVVALGIGSVAGQQWYVGQVVATAQLQGAVTRGSAMVVVRRSGAAELELRGLETPPDGHVYAAWVIGADGRPILSGASPSGQATLRLSETVAGRMVAISVEPEPPGLAPTRQPILAAAVPA